MSGGESFKTVENQSQYNLELHVSRCQCVPIIEENFYKENFDAARLSIRRRSFLITNTIDTNIQETHYEWSYSGKLPHKDMLRNIACMPFKAIFWCVSFEAMHDPHSYTIWHTPWKYLRLWTKCLIQERVIFTRCFERKVIEIFPISEMSWSNFRSILRIFTSEIYFHFQHRSK
jgi:hypothetical protein